MPSGYGTAVSEPTRIDVDVAVIGAGGAGLYTALTAADEGATVALVSATPLAQTASYWAQGGIAAAIALDDSPAEHLSDTEIAGRGLTQAQRRRGAGRTRRPRRCSGSSSSASASTPTATATSPSASRAATPSAASSMPAGSATGGRVVRALSALAVEHPRIAVIESRATDLWAAGDRMVRAC